MWYKTGMDISYLGQSSFKIKGKNITVITDPFDPKAVGLKYPMQETDIVTISHHHKDHDYVDGVKAKNPETPNRPMIIDGPGEYEVGGVNILGMTTFHDKVNGAERGKNTIYEFRIDNLILVHLGDLGHKLTDQQKETLDTVDILFIPTGSTYCLDLHECSEVVAQLEPKIVIPMHYKVPGINQEVFGHLAPVDDFLKQMGKTEVAPLDKFSITKDKLPEEMEIVILK